MTATVGAEVAIVLSIVILGVFGAAAIFHASGSPANVTVPTTSTQVSVAVSDPAGVRSVEVYERNPAVSPAASLRLDVKAFNCPTAVNIGPYSRASSTSQYLVFVDNCLSSSGGPGGDITFQRFNADGSASGAVHTMTPRQYGPGPGTLQIHEYPDDPASSREAADFGSGTLDLMDCCPPSGYVNAWTAPGGIVSTGKAGLSKVAQFGMFQVDINNWNFPTNDRSLRQALGYLIDRQQVVNSFAEGLALPNCAGTGPGQPGTLSCSQLGYPTAYGDFNPAKALQILNENGWRDSNSNGVLEAPNGTEPVLTFYVRSDDNVMRLTGDLLTYTLQNLPRSYTSSTAGTVTVCVATPVCRLSLNEQVLPRALISPIVLRSTGVTKWNLYTGGWAEGAVQHLYYFFSSHFAWSTCGGGWTLNIAATNYPCYVDAAFDSIARPLNEGPTYADVLNAGVIAQRYLWGYANGKITGTMPTIPLYSRQSYSAYYLSDTGANAMLNPDGSHACWKGWVGQEQGYGLGQIMASTTGVFGYNCQEQKPGYTSYKGQGVLDWGVHDSIDGLNIVSSEIQPDILTLQQVYDSCLSSSAISPQEIVPSMCQSFGETQVFNTDLNMQTTLGVYKFQDGLRWSDGQYATAWDFKFAVEYTLANYGFNSYLISDLIHIDVLGADSSNGIGGTAVAYFDTVGPFLGRYLGQVPIIAQHVWCPSWPDIATNCPYPYADSFPNFDFTKQVGTGPMIVTGCQPVGACTNTITEQPNPYYTRGTAFWDIPGDVQLQPDVNRDDQVNQEDLDILTQVIDFGVTGHPAFDVDYRTDPVADETFTNAVGTGTFTVTEQGPSVKNTDLYIVQHFIFEGQQRGLPGGITWPPGRTMTYNWPDTNRDNSVNVDDLIAVYLHQFQNPMSPVSGVAMNDVNYDGSIDLSDLIIAFTRQFTKPAGVP